MLVADHNHDSGTAAELTSRGEPVSAAFIAVMSDDALFTPTDPRGSLAIADAKKLSSSIPRRIERPPRSRLA